MGSAEGNRGSSPTAMHGGAMAPGRRFFIGIGVGKYQDVELDLARAEADVVDIAEWFTTRSGVAHSHELTHLGKSPTAAEILQSLRNFLQQRSEDDVIVIYIACHGELESARAHLFGSDTPRRGLAGLSVDASSFGAIIGGSKPHNVLIIVDACVAGSIATTIQRAVEDASAAEGTLDPRRRYAQVVIASTFGRDPALDGRFAQAFLSVVSDERWTGSTNRWLAIDQLIDGINEELKDLQVPQVVDRKVWGPAAVELIPNPNVASRRLGQLMADEEFQAHFDPSARGVGRGETGSFFTGREQELKRIVEWLRSRVRYHE